MQDRVLWAKRVVQERLSQTTLCTSVSPPMSHCFTTHLPGRCYSLPSAGEETQAQGGWVILFEVMELVNSRVGNADSDQGLSRATHPDCFPPSAFREGTFTSPLRHQNTSANASTSSSAICTMAVFWVHWGMGAWKHPDYWGQLVDKVLSIWNWEIASGRRQKEDNAMLRVRMKG